MSLHDHDTEPTGWCAGWQRHPHVPDDGLIRTSIGPDIFLCRPCWAAWIRTDTHPSRRERGGAQ